MKSQNLKILSILLSFSLMPLVGLSKEAPDEDQGDQTTMEDSAPTIIVCNDLKEKIDTVAPVQKKVSDDLASIQDTSLCNALSQQCEYFYKITKYYEKEYRSQCVKGYEIKVSACNYESSGCPRIEESGNPGRMPKHRT